MSAIGNVANAAVAATCGAWLIGTVTIPCVNVASSLACAGSIAGSVAAVTLHAVVTGINSGNENDKRDVGGNVILGHKMYRNGSMVDTKGLLAGQVEDGHPWQNFNAMASDNIFTVYEHNELMDKINDKPLLSYFNGNVRDNKIDIAVAYNTHLQTYHALGGGDLKHFHGKHVNDTQSLEKRDGSNYLSYNFNDGIKSVAVKAGGNRDDCQNKFYLDEMYADTFNNLDNGADYIPNKFCSVMRDHQGEFVAHGEIYYDAYGGIDGQCGDINWYRGLGEITEPDTGFEEQC